MQQSRTRPHPHAVHRQAGVAGNAVYRRPLELGCLLPHPLHPSHRALSLADTIAVLDRRVLRKAVDRADRLTIAGLLKQSGYRTACVGKWHLGWDWPIPDKDKKLFFAKPKKPVTAPSDEQKSLWREVFRQPIGGGPTTRGFDLYFGTDVPNWPPFCFVENDHTVGIPSEFLPASLLKNNQASEQGPALPGWTLEPILPTLADRACRFIEESSQEKKPFFLYLPLTAPHTPLAVSNAWKNKSGLNAYADFVMETDAVVGQVLAAIDKSDAAHHTLVVFTSDNGCAPTLGLLNSSARGIFPAGHFAAIRVMPGKVGIACRSWSAGRAWFRREAAATSLCSSLTSSRRSLKSWEPVCRTIVPKTA